jgi:radical SAM protein with 4Fe4S-binding SPASM domain
MTSIDELHAQLNNRYNIVCFVDLAEVTKSPSAIFKLFRDCHKEVFEPAHRLVLYSSELPSEKLLNHVQKAAVIIDISNNFILICCPHNIADTLANTGKKYGFDTPIQNNVVELSSDSMLADDFYVADTVCPLAWSHLEITHQGNIRPCCIHPNIVGNIQKDQVIDAFHSSAMSELRNNLLTGTRASGCRNCWATEDVGQLSNRQRHLNLHAKEFYTDWIDNPKIRSLDVKPGNTCNFKCRICGPIASSLHANEQLTHMLDRSKIIQIKHNMSTVKWADTDLFTSQLESGLPQLTSLDVYGGEPFLLKQLPLILQKAVDLDVAKNIRLHFNSNGSIFPHKLIPLFEKFKEIDIALSIDNIGNQFELERGGAWTDVEKNIINFISLQKSNIRVYLFPTINIQNVLYLEELLDWAAQIGIELTYNLLHDPQYLNINNMTESAKQLVMDRFRNSKYPILQAIVEQVRNSKGSDGSIFVQHMKEYDRRRSEDLLLTHKEIAHAMGYVL